MNRDSLLYRVVRVPLSVPLPQVMEPRAGGVSRRVLVKKRWSLARRRTFGSSDLDRLENLIGDTDVLPLRSAIGRGPAESFIALRHDTDYDIENAVRFARWEASRGFRSTYFVLHSDWYYHDTRGEPSRFVLRALDEIASLGHEIGLHNNAIASALRTNEEADAILDRELVALRRHGFDVIGSAAHGDDICHEAHFVNYELFSDCPRADYGAPDRTLCWRDATTTLRPRPMADFGLEYEANFIVGASYLADVGGVWSQPAEQAFARVAEGFIQVLVHPLYWNFG